jgi:hypothetical protein
MPEQPSHAHPQTPRVAVRVAAIVVVWVTQRIPGRLVGDRTSPRFDRPRVRRAGV